ncbi:MAG: tRNA-dihydrouridine(16) synthase [Chlamydiia bacterium]|nr:tRNA-dihydrouridine(16) synthase [Chlamydiia bacterium]MCH9624126.1 tRNA-dihydrouridine(16) synthase [Chlamydiia bacterium]
MEGLGNYSFRNALALIGGFDEATREFISVPKGAHVKSLAKKFSFEDTDPIPQAAQVMGSDPDTLAAMTEELIARGAKRVELNVGCPSNTVTGNGSGSSLLQNPEHLHKILSKMVKVSSVPLTAKLRSGYLDTTLFEENLLAAESAGISHLTLHPRTKLEGYKGFANLDLIKKAKEILSIPLIGNGDIKSREDAEYMLAYTGCDGLMVGRGAVINPWIFHEIKGNAHIEDFDRTLTFLERFYENVCLYAPKNQTGQMKGLFSFLFQRNDALLVKRKDMLRNREKDPRAFFEYCIDALRACQLAKL